MEGQAYGPYTLEEFHNLNVPGDVEVMEASVGDWLPASEYPSYEELKARENGYVIEPDGGIRRVNDSVVEGRLEKFKKGIQKKQGFFEYYFWDLFFRNYLNFDGVAPLRQYLVGTLVCLPLFWVFLYALAAFVISLTPSDAPMPIGTLYLIIGVPGLILFIPGLAATVRRLRDTGKSPWWYFIGLVPIIGPFWLFILTCMEGKTNSERTKFGIGDGLILLLIVAMLSNAFIGCSNMQ